MKPIFKILPVISLALYSLVLLISFASDHQAKVTYVPSSVIVIPVILLCIFFDLITRSFSRTIDEQVLKVYLLVCYVLKVLFLLVFISYSLNIIIPNIFISKNLAVISSFTKSMFTYFISTNLIMFVTWIIIKLSKD